MFAICASNSLCSLCQLCRLQRVFRIRRLRWLRHIQMKRDPDLIRKLLLRFEKTEEIRLSRPDLATDGYSEEQVRLHLDLLEEKGWLDHHIVQMGMTRFDTGYRPTHDGYDFLDSVRDPQIWEKTKQGARKVGALSLDVLSDIAKGIIKKRIADLSGVEVEF
ncbi:MAG: DUF2513 domain-containing protein [Mesorhizobium sp.]|nr:DUF2513 domain-containing protein [Mesorhizobium sp. M5C.F.Ca.IN.020.14.1.1]RWI36088.1 MAG: DUF2513 domain-containing protein [Mesorhizobium sp.]RWI63098.1 MAG: DUF2513 domain-containing protein [Mesorhizobium sp.]RWJ25338.1 MAG: DUF2513 domain-containing protein [Mesorhizobium sp.]TIQ70021.1 MAG: DUF2513 domain-containing protein [Mesorhizobium sp.]